MKKFFTLALLVGLTLTTGAQEKKCWDFTQGLSDETIANLNAETKGGMGENVWDFDAMRAEADAAWNRELGRVQATFTNDRDRRIFYTAMYHFMVAPQTWDDANGDWRGADNKVYRSFESTAPKQCEIIREGDATAPKASTSSSPVGNSKYLTTLSLWDTYRAAASINDNDREFQT